MTDELYTAEEVFDQIKELVLASGFDGKTIAKIANDVIHSCGGTVEIVYNGDSLYSVKE